MCARRATVVLSCVLAGACADEPSLVDELGGDDDTAGIVATTGSSGEGTAQDSQSVPGESTSSSTGAESTSTTSTSTSATDRGEVTGAVEYPIAEEDRYVVAPDALPLMIDAAAGVLANDEAGTAGPLEVTAFQSDTQEGGVVDVSPDGSFSYLAAEGFSGEDRFIYTVTDTHGGSDTARVRLIVLEAL
jgi:hypothetical protein